MVRSVRFNRTTFSLQPCPTYNDINTRDWYAGKDLKERAEAEEGGDSAAARHARIYKLEDTGYDPVVHYSEESEVDARLGQALTKSLEWGDRIPIGVFYRNELVTPYAGRIADKIPNYEENPPAVQRIERQGRPATDVSALLDSLEI